MGITQYIGSRYVPVFADTLYWSSTRTYEPLTITLHEGNSYTSKQYVPAGIDIANGDYWALTGNYNAQVEQYRKEVANYDARITTANGTANSALSLAQTNEQNIATLDAQMTGTQDSGLKSYIGEETQKIIFNEYDGYSAVWIGDSYVEANSLGSPTTRFARQVCDYFGLTEINYAKGGTGYTVENTGNNGKKFAGQLENAIADTSYDHAKVKYVFVAGGRNDASNISDMRFTNINAVLVEVQNIVNLAHANYPNAELVFIPMMYDCTAMSGNQTSFYDYFCWMVKTSIPNTIKYTVIKNAYLWLNGRYAAVFNKDKIHPNQSGHNLIAKQIISNLLGFGSLPNNIVQYYSSVLTPASDRTSKTPYLNVDNDGNIWMQYDVYTTDEIPFGQSLFTYSPGVAYDSVDSLFTIRGTYQASAFLTDYSTSTNSIVPVQVVFDNNYSTKDAKFNLTCQYLGSALTGSATKHLIVNYCIGRIGRTITSD